MGFLNFSQYPQGPPCWTLFLLKLKAFKHASLLKRDSKAGVFLWILQSFQKQLLLENFYGGCFWANKKAFLWARSEMQCIIKMQQQSRWGFSVKNYKNFIIFTGKHSVPESLFEKEALTQMFSYKLWGFIEHLFCRTCAIDISRNGCTKTSD